MSGSLLPYVPQTPSAVAVEIQKISKSHPMRSMHPHGHVFYELLFIRNGHGFHTIGSTEFEAEPGTVFLIAPGVLHDARNLGDVDARVILFLPDALSPGKLSENTLGADTDNLIGRLFNQPVLQTTRPIKLSKESFQIIDQSINSMERELIDRNLGYEMSVAAMLQLTLIQVARSSSWLNKVSTEEKKSLNERDLTGEIFNDIDQHFAGDCSLDAASQRIGFNASYLTTKIKQLTGNTYGFWVIERKMIEARKLLATTDDSISTVAHKLGYAEIESFVRRFKTHHATSPSQWRRAAREQAAL